MSKLPSITNNNLNQIFFALLPDHHSGQNLGNKEKLSEIQDLLRYGVDVNGEVQPGITPLCKTIKDGGSKILVELLIHYGAELDNSPSGFEWTDTDGQIIRNQVYALAKQRTIRCKDKESEEILQLIQKQLVQKQLPQAETEQAEQAGFETDWSARAGFENNAGVSATASLGRSTKEVANNGSASLFQNAFSTAFVCNNTSTNGTGYGSNVNTINNVNNLNNANSVNHGNVASLPLQGIMIKKKIFVFEFDNTLVNEHFHRILKKMGVAPGHASSDLVEFLFLKYGMKNKEILHAIFKDILDNEDCICIASNSRYPETIYAMINNLGLSESEKQQIFYVPPDLNTTEDLTIGKNLDIFRAMLHFHIIDINAVYLIDQDRTNLQIARVKLNIPDSNLIKVDPDPNPAPNHLHYIQNILKKSKVTKFETNSKQATKLMQAHAFKNLGKS